jgi:hypothetical protein
MSLAANPANWPVLEALAAREGMLDPDPPAPAPAPAPEPTVRIDGWTPDRQRAFLEALAEGHTVEAACRMVALTVSSAYALRRRAGGAAFALGWQAAVLVARQHVADTLMTRALDGQTDTVTRPDGLVVERHRHDNRLGLALLSRLDRLADSAASEGTHHAARLVAQEFDGFLALVGGGAGAAGAGLFLGLRAGRDAPPEHEAVVALARADRFARAGAGLPEEVEVADLRPADRAGWTADQWRRAEAAGFLRIDAPAEVEATASEPPLPPLREGAAGDGPDAEDDDDEPVWFEPDQECFVTHFPPPDDFEGESWGDPEDADYFRTLTDEEEDAFDNRRRLLLAPRHAARDRWLAAGLALGRSAAGSDGGEADPGARAAGP